MVQRLDSADRQTQSVIRVRLWTWWTGPLGSVPPGTEMDVDAATAQQIVQGGGGEIIPRSREVAMVETPQQAVASGRPKPRRRKRP